MLTIDNIIDMIKSNKSKTQLSDNASVIKIYSENLVTDIRPNFDINGDEYVCYDVRQEGILIAEGNVYNTQWDTLVYIVNDSTQENVKNLIFSEYGIE